MKKFIVLLLVLMLLLGVVGCKSESFELALVTDHGPIDDKSFNQGAWEGVENYATDNNKTYKYYRPTESSAAGRLDSIAIAVKGGAKVVVCPGFAFGEVVYEAQTKYPDVKFILLDADPHSADFSDFKITDNTYSIYYAEEQAGFLAGYAAVKEGMTELGFMGGVSVPAVIRFGVGYIEGADYAAQEEGVDVNVMYTYTGGFAAKPEIKTLASSWFNGGTEVVFSAAGGAINNNISAAEEIAGKKVIGCNVDQSSISETIITSSLKLLTESVYNGISDYYNDSFKGGQIENLAASNNGVALTDDFSKFENFTASDYEVVLDKLKSGEIVVTSETELDIANDLNVMSTTVTLVE